MENNPAENNKPNDLYKLFNLPPDYTYTAKNLDRPPKRALGNGILVFDTLGHAPVQFEGTVDDKCFYFRSRGNHWSLNIDDDSDSCVAEDTVTRSFSCRGRYSDSNDYAASYIPYEQAEEIIRCGIDLWRRGRILIG